MFDSVLPAPPDAILGLNDAFKHDPRPEKINLGVGVYKDDQGRTPVLRAVKQAEQRLVEREDTKNYKPIDGDPAYLAQVQALLLGADHALIAARRIATLHTPGGTGALRVAADYIAKQHSGASVWLSDPTWANHAAIFQAAGLTPRTYRYFDPAINGLNFDAMLESLSQVPAGDVVLLHGCCHNPTGADPDADQWKLIAATLAKRGALPLLDFAYQGFGSGLREDAVGLEALLDHHAELLICSSFSKNFGLYNERVGALTIIAASTDATAAVLSQIKAVVRANYSNPPSHGGAVVATVLTDPALRSLWEEELKAMCQRIHRMRQTFAQALTAHDVLLNPAGNDFITAQRGMFSFSGLSKAQVQRLRDEHAVYIVGSGRINVAGITEGNLDALVQAIARVAQPAHSH